MNTTQENRLKKNITRRYLFALVLIAILSTSAYYMLQISFQKADLTAYLTTISGKQRMLNQQIALDVNNIYYKFDTANNSLKVKLLLNIQEMRNANAMLSSGKLPENKEILLSSTMHDIYFGDTNLAKRIEDYTTLALKIIDVKDKEGAYEIMQNVLKDSEVLVVDLDKVVMQYPHEGETELQRVRRVVDVLFCAILLVLFLELIFIFQPIVRNIVKLSKDKDDLLLDLQNQVELRTVHLENANKRLSDLAHHDPLTGLFNRLRLEKDMQTFIDQYLIHRSHFAVLMLDVDWFKKVNDSYGHEIGDFVLKELAKIFHAVCRDEDKIYRAGGEEFVILLDQISYADAYKVAKKINQKIEKHEFKKGNLSFYKTVSIGMCHSSILFDEDYKVMLRAADMGLYQAKENGRNRIEVATKAS